MKNLQKKRDVVTLFYGSEFVFDPHLSLSAKGLLITILCFPDEDEDEFTPEDFDFNDESEEISNRAWDELVENGYINVVGNHISVSPSPDYKELEENHD